MNVFCKYTLNLKYFYTRLLRACRGKLLVLTYDTELLTGNKPGNIKFLVLLLQILYIFLVKNIRLLDLLVWIIRRTAISKQSFNDTVKMFYVFYDLKLPLCACYTRTFQTIAQFFKLRLISNTCQEK